MKQQTTKYKPANELLPLTFEDMGDSSELFYADGYESDYVEDFDMLRADANYHLAWLFINNILKIEDDNNMNIQSAVVDLLYKGGKSFQQIEKIIREEFNIKK